MTGHLAPATPAIRDRYVAAVRDAYVAHHNHVIAGDNSLECVRAWCRTASEARTARVSLRRALHRSAIREGMRTVPGLYAVHDALDAAWREGWRAGYYMVYPAEAGEGQV